MISMDSIYTYFDYRVVLSDYFSIRKARSKGRFSWRAFAKEAGFRAPNHMQQIISGKKNISLEGARRLSTLMCLPRAEGDYFEALVLFNQSSSETREQAFKKMSILRKRAEKPSLLADQHEYVSRWIYVVIRELSSLREFRLDPNYICRALFIKISPTLAKAAGDLLARLSLIEKTAENRWRPTQSHLAVDAAIAAGVDPELRSQWALSYHRETIQQALHGLSQPAHLREYGALTMAVSQSQFLEVKKRVSMVIEDIQGYLAGCSDEPDRVCQLNLNLFHLTKSK